MNPIATILAAKMMLDWLGETEKGRALEAAAAAVIAEGKVRTYDMGGSAHDARDGARPSRRSSERDARRDPMTQRSSSTRSGPRDGLQMEKQVVPIEPQGRPGSAPLLAPGVDIVQVGSFVHPEKVPQMADTDELFRRLVAPGGQPARRVLSGLVLNEKGLERGLACGVEMFCMGVSASETHSRKNTGMGIAEATAAHHRDGEGRRSRRASGCRSRCSRRSAAASKGAVPEERVLGIVRAVPRRGPHAASASPTPPGTRTPDAGRAAVRRGPRARPGDRVRLPLPQHLRPGHGQRLRGAARRA